MSIIINNAVVNARNTPYVITGLIATRPIEAANGTVFISTDEGKIYSYNLATAAWILVGSSTGGGGGLDLQGTCDIGNVTDTEVVINTPAGATRSFKIRGNFGVDNRGVDVLSDDSEDSGYIQLKNKTGNVGTIINDLSVSDDRFTLPDKSGGGGTFAMTSDLPQNGTITPGTIIIINLNSITPVYGVYQSFGNLVHVSYSFEVDVPIGGAGSPCRFSFDLPLTYGGAVADAIGSGAASDPSTTILSPVYVLGSGLSAVCSFRAPADGTNKLNFSCFYQF